MRQNYVAAQLTPDGQLIRHDDNYQVLNIPLGEFDREVDAINQACAQLECEHTVNGIILKGNNQGGYMVVNTQELEAL